MSLLDDSDFILPSPEIEGVNCQSKVPYAGFGGQVETPIGLLRKNMFSHRSRNEAKLKNGAYLKNCATTISESDDEDDIEIVSINSTSNDTIQIDESCIISSDLEASADSSILKPKMGLVKGTPYGVLHKETTVIASTPNFDPSTPVGRWRPSPNDSLSEESEDESPIVNHNRGRAQRIGIIDSDSEEERGLEEESGEDLEEERDSEEENCEYSEEERDSEEENGENDKSKDNALYTPSQSVRPLVDIVEISELETNKNDISIVDLELKTIMNKYDKERNVKPADNISNNYYSADSDHVDSNSSKLEDGASNHPRDVSLPEISPFRKGNKSIFNSSENIHNTSAASHTSANTSISSVTSTKSLNTSNMSEVELKSQLKNKKFIMKTVNVNALPDNGAKLKNQIAELEEALSNCSLGSIKEDESNVGDTSRCSVGSAISDASSYISVGSGSSDKENNNANSPEIEVISEPWRDQLSSHLQSLKDQLHIKQALYKSSNLRSLADGGSKLRQSIARLEKDIMLTEFNSKVKEPDVVKESAPPRYQTKMDGLQIGAISKVFGGKAGYKLDKKLLETRYDKDKDYAAHNYGGKLSEDNERNILRMTTDAVQSLHVMLKSMPDVEVEEEEQPRGLKVELMPHQRRGLAWLLWRESQQFPGGILADDMGLGKTLTMLSLILKHKAMVDNGDILDDFSALGKKKDGEDGDWLPRRGRPTALDSILPSRGTLVVCPASLLGQWEGEARKHVSSKKLSVFVYHGNSRDISMRRLASYDIVITTYQLVMRQAFSAAVAKNLKKNCDVLPDIAYNNQGPLFQIGWTRIILDEAHQIKNHKSKTSQAACMLKGARRWAVTGTPVQNKEMDLYSLVRFIRISPFDDYICWKHQLQGTRHGMKKLNMLVKALLLRRTKGQIDQKTGKAIVTLPPKVIVQHKFSLGQDEREVYDRVFAFSRANLIRYMKSQEEKEREKAERLGTSFRPNLKLNVDIESDKYTPTLQGDLLKIEDLKSVGMLVLLLRLRQICNHPALIRSIIEDETKATEGLVDGAAKDTDELDLIAQMDEMSLNRGDQEEEIDNRVRDAILNIDNPIFKKKTTSSKIAKVIEELEILEEKGDYEKAVIVSQWTSMLEIVYKHLRKRRIETSAITGQIPVKDRADIVDEFNEENVDQRFCCYPTPLGVWD